MATFAEEKTNKQSNAMTANTIAAFIVTALLMAACCKKTIPARDCVEKAVQTNCVCTKIYKPVCGCNGKTYGNECEARCHNITKFTEGECPK